LANIDLAASVASEDTGENGGAMVEPEIEVDGE
jgi:hypothetical protein